MAHEFGALQQFLSGCEPCPSVTVETLDNWYGIVD
jgi:hypothetical protein